MLSRHFSAGLAVCLLLCLWPLPFAHADDSEPLEVCREHVIEKLSYVHDIYRSVLFGSREDSDGKFIANTGGEVDARRTGIFEVRYRETSELLWAIVESYRVLNCKSLYVCKAMSGSFGTESEDPIPVELLGCKAELVPPYRECQFNEKGSVPETATLTTDCTQLVQDTLAMEQGVLHLAVAYDSGYRGALQFVGMTDWMMKDFPKRAFIPLRGMVNMLGKLYQIPCFLGQCDMPDNSDIRLPEGDAPLNNPPNSSAPRD